jgi:hypothetical protein
VQNLDAIATGLEACGGRVISAGILTLEGCLGERWHRALQIADPDGHRLQLVSR